MCSSFKSSQLYIIFYQWFSDKILKFTGVKKQYLLKITQLLSDGAGN